MRQQSNSHPQTLIITGMHRSGTSLTASLLESAGVDVGRRLLQSHESNKKGHFENLDFLDFHSKVLFSQGVSPDGWTEETVTVPEQFLAKAKSIVQKNMSQPVWGWKEPRTTLFLDFWANLLPEAKFIFVYRSPWEVIDSLYRRGDATFVDNPNFALQVWLNYNEIIRNFCDRFSKRCLLFKLENIIKDPNILVTSIKDKFGIPLKAVDNLYEENLLNHQVANSHRPVLIKTYFPEAIALYQELDKRAVQVQKFDSYPVNEADSLPSYSEWVLQDWLNVRRQEAQLQQLQQTQTQLQQTQTQLQQTQTQLQQTQTQLQQTQTQLQQTQTQLQQTQTNLMAMKSSKFWKLRTSWFRLKGVIGLHNND